MTPRTRLFSLSALTKPFTTAKEVKPLVVSAPVSNPHLKPADADNGSVVVYPPDVFEEHQRAAQKAADRARMDEMKQSYMDAVAAESARWRRIERAERWEKLMSMIPSLPDMPQLPEWTNVKADVQPANVSAADKVPLRNFITWRHIQANKVRRT